MPKTSTSSPTCRGEMARLAAHRVAGKGEDKHWFNVLGEIGVDMVKSLRESVPVTICILFLSRAKSTHNALIENLEDEPNSSLFPQLFPIK